MFLAEFRGAGGSDGAWSMGTLFIFYKQEAPYGAGIPGSNSIMIHF